jgi:arsenate reductase-like glutaredoxin family protein
MKRVNFHLTERQIAELQELHEKTGLAVAEMIRRAVDAYIELGRKKGNQDRVSR